MNVVSTSHGGTSKAPGRVITFYSYKGGTGRSMALANVAWVLASSGRRVLVIDWDLAGVYCGSDTRGGNAFERTDLQAALRLTYRDR